MLRLSIIILTVFTCFNSYAQKRKFEKFDDELGNGIVIQKQSIEHGDNYQLKWVKIVATYGGSPYCCVGKIIKIRKDIVYPDTNLYFKEGLLPHKLNTSKLESFNDEEFLVETFEYFEPQPTSGEHYVYITYYYEEKE